MAGEKTESNSGQGSEARQLARRRRSGCGGGWKQTVVRQRRGVRPGRGQALNAVQGEVKTPLREHFGERPRARGCEGGVCLSYQLRRTVRVSVTNVVERGYSAMPSYPALV